MHEGHDDIYYSSVPSTAFDYWRSEVLYPFDPVLIAAMQDLKEYDGKQITDVTVLRQFSAPNF